MTTITHDDPRRGPSNDLLGAAFFLASEAVFFLGLVFVALEVRRSFATWPPLGVDAFAPLLVAGGQVVLVGTRLLVFNTGLILAAAASATLAHRAARRDDRPGMMRGLGGALALGAAFLAMQAFELSRLGGWLSGAGEFRMLFDVVAFLHGLHVLAGLALLAVVLWRASMGHFSSSRRGLVRATEWYWLFVAGAWLVLLAVLTVV